MKRGLFYPHRRRLRAALALSAALLLYSCDPPASPLPASPSSAVPEVTLPNMAQIERRFKDQYAESARSTDGVSFALDKPEISPDGKTVVRAKITYAAGKLLSLEVGGKNHRIQTVEIETTVDRKANPTTFAYKDTSNKTQKRFF